MAIKLRAGIIGVLLLLISVRAYAQVPTCAGTASNTGGTTLPLTAPAGTADGSLMVAVISSNSTDIGWIAPAPFVQLATAGGLSAVLYSGVQVGASPGTYTWTGLDGSPNHSGIIIACEGSGGIQTFSANNGGTGLAVANSVTPLFSDEINYLFYNANGGFSTPSGYTVDQATNHGGNTFAASFFLASPTVGTPTGNVSSSTSGAWGAFQVLIEGPTPTPTATAAPTATPTAAPTPSLSKVLYGGSMGRNLIGGMRSDYSHGGGLSN